MSVRRSAAQRVLLLMDHSLDFVELVGAGGLCDSDIAARTANGAPFRPILVGLRLSMDAARMTREPLVLDEMIDPWIVHVQDVIGRLHNLTIKLRAQPISEQGLRLKICLYIEDLKLADGQNLRLDLGDGLGLRYQGGASGLA